MKILRLLAICMTLVCFFNLVQAQTNSVRQYLSAALDIMQNRSVNKNRVNWDSLRHATYMESKNMRTIPDTYPLIKKALQSLKDEHSDYYPPEVVQAYLLGYRKTGQPFPSITSYMVKGKIAYIQLPAIACYNYEEWDEYVANFYQKIVELNYKKPSGWIIDIRANTGGMFYPMFAAISPFLDSKTAIGTIDAEKKKTYFIFKNKVIYEGSNFMHRFKVVNIPQIRNAPVAVLVDKITASSGEFSAIAFHGQKNTAIIGETTQGLTSGNQEFKMSDGGFLKLTTGNTIDRKGREYAVVGAGLLPDIVIAKGKSEQENQQSYMNTAEKFIASKHNAKK